MNAHLDALRRMAGANDEVLPRPRPNLVENVSALLDRTEYRRCDHGEDLEDIYRLRYKAYRLAGMVGDSASQLVHDRFDEAPNCHRFGVYVDGMLAGTIRLHVLSDEHATSPATAIYPDVLLPRIARRERFIDPTRFAADPDLSRIYPHLPYVTMRLPIMACFHFGAPTCVSMIKQEHVAFYKRVFQATLMGEARPYGGGITTTVQLYRIDVPAIHAPVAARYPFFLSTTRERRMLFADRALTEPAPLTILPTAKYLSEAA